MYLDNCVCLINTKKLGYTQFQNKTKEKKTKLTKQMGATDVWENFL